MQALAPGLVQARALQVGCVQISVIASTAAYCLCCRHLHRGRLRQRPSAEVLCGWARRTHLPICLHFDACFGVLGAPC